MTVNFTILAPDGTTNHGNQHLICVPPQWYDYLIFYFTNYFSHAFTVISYPGQGTYETIQITVMALLLPTSGVVRACRAILLHAGTVRHDLLKRAARARALCMVIDQNPKSRQNSIDDGVSRMETLSPKLSGSDRSPTSREQVGDLPDLSTGESRPVAINAAVTDSTTESQLLSESRKDKHWWELPSDGWIVPIDAKINGEFKLPKGYVLRFVPVNAPLRCAKHDGSPVTLRHQDLAIPSNYNIPKLIISFIQAAWAITTLYRTRGDQILEFGYAAYGLTVAPYAFMSIVNIIANLLTPEYSSIFMVRTPGMDAAEKDGGFFMGEIPVVLDPEPYEGSDDLVKEISKLIGFVISIIPLSIVFKLSRLRSGNSTTLQRGLTMSWLAIGIFMGSLNPASAVSAIPVSHEIGYVRRLTALVIFLGWTFVIGFAAIGGLVIVGLEIRDFGICTAI